MAIHLDINCDLGEITDFDNHKIMPYIHSCSIACGGHAGDDKSIYKSIEDAKKYRLNIGAHPSYPDRNNFGRKSIKMSDKELYDSLYTQLGLFLGICKDLEVSCKYIKPHGALYHDLSTDQRLLDILQKVLVDHRYEGYILLIYGNQVVSSYDIKQEIFLDRAYESDLSLRSRVYPDAIIHNLSMIEERLTQLRDHQVIKCVDGIYRPVKAESICIHSDTKNAVEIAQMASEILFPPDPKF